MLRIARTKMYLVCGSVGRKKEEKRKTTTTKQQHMNETTIKQKTTTTTRNYDIINTNHNETVHYQSWTIISIINMITTEPDMVSIKI